MIRAMNGGMALRASPCREVKIVGRASRGGVLGFNVALLAEARPFHLEQLVMLGTVRFVTVQAVFPDRRVLPKERSSFLGMAGVTVFIRSVLNQKFRTCASMGVVAIRTFHFSFPQRHVGGFHGLSLP